MILSSTCAFELNYIVFGGRCENIVSLGIKVIHDLTIYASAS